MDFLIEHSGGIVAVERREKWGDTGLGLRS
jgi:hypothetical protein